jgi:hypothetical protein
LFLTENAKSSAISMQAPRVAMSCDDVMERLIAGV